jgi:hypothetical protein
MRYPIPARRVLDLTLVVVVRPDLIPITLLLDIVWCALYGPYYNSGTALLGLIMTVFNMFLKMPWAFYAHEHMTEQGGAPLAILTPGKDKIMNALLSWIEAPGTERLLISAVVEAYGAYASRAE